MKIYIDLENEKGVTKHYGFEYATKIYLNPCGRYFGIIERLPLPQKGNADRDYIFRETLVSIWELMVKKLIITE